MQKERFEALVVRAINELPSEFQSRLENVDVVVEDYPTAIQLGSNKAGERMHLLGLYEGVPQARRGRHYGMVMPDKITIFQKPIEAIAHTDKEIEMEIQKVVRHEIAHHFGSSEETLRRLESD
jgi:predicted Zn-dependent protease with MMP-like domain